MEAQSEYINIADTFFAPFGADLYAQSVLINKNFCVGAQSEVYQACVVGWAVVNTDCDHQEVREETNR